MLNEERTPIDYVDAGPIDANTYIIGLKTESPYARKSKPADIGHLVGDALFLNKELKGVAGGIAELDSSGKVPSSQLPSYVDDVIEGYLYNNKFYKESTHVTEIVPESGKIYVDITDDKNLSYRWSGTAYSEIGSSLALGETSTTAYRGDRGKTAYDHSQLTSGNPHNVTAQDLNLSTVATTGSYNDLLNKPTIPAAQVNADWNAVSGVAQILNKPTIPTVPTRLSAFTDDLGSSPTHTHSQYLTSHQDISGKADKATTLAGYGITDAKIANGIITLGTNTIKPVTDISGKADKATTLAGYGITDAKIVNGTITLGVNTITPITDVSDRVPTSRTVNGKALSSNISLTAADVGAAASSHTHDYAGSASAGGPASTFAVGAGTANVARYIYFADSDYTGASPTEGKACYDSEFKYNPSTNDLSITKINGVAVGSSPKFTDTTYESKAAASGGTAVSLVTTGEKYTWNNKADAFTVTNGGNTASWGASCTVGTVKGINLTFTMPANPNTDTKNTAGSTNSTSKLFLIGATSQAANPQTYSNQKCYVGTDNCLYSNGTMVSVSGHTHSYAGSSSAGGAANSVAKSLTLKIKTGSTEGTDKYTFDGSGAKTLDIKEGSNISLTAAAGSVTIANTYSYTHPSDGGNTGNFGPSADATPGSGGTFSVPYITVNSAGHVTAASTKTITMPTVTDTKNTAGSTNSTSTLYLIGATSQAANPQTYSNGNVYATNGALYATSFNATSALDRKREIEPVDFKAVDLIKTVGIVKFKFKHDAENNQKVGFIADYTDPLFATKHQDTMDLYNCTGILMKAVQELSKEIEELKKR